MEEVITALFAAAKLPEWWAKWRWVMMLACKPDAVPLATLEGYHGA